MLSPKPKNSPENSNLCSNWGRRDGRFGDAGRRAAQARSRSSRASSRPPNLEAHSTMAEPEQSALLTTLAGKYYNQFVWKVSELIGSRGGSRCSRRERCGTGVASDEPI